MGIFLPRFFCSLQIFLRFWVSNSLGFGMGIEGVSIPLFLVQLNTAAGEIPGIAQPCHDASGEPSEDAVSVKTRLEMDSGAGTALG